MGGVYSRVATQPRILIHVWGVDTGPTWLTLVELRVCQVAHGGVLAARFRMYCGGR